MYLRFWIFYYRSVPKNLKWKHDKIGLRVGNWISRFNVVFVFSRFELGVNWYHISLEDGLLDKE
jgi:hypothetical protein